ncbi:MAG: LuxE/PaaK family acyltransferase [Promethearchaeota archaeon]
METRSEFFESLERVVKSTAEQCKIYGRICEKQEFDFDTTLNDSNLDEIPFISWQYFKESNQKFHEMLRIPLENLPHWTISSSTSGDPSVVGRCTRDAEVFKDNYARVFDDYSAMSTLKKLILFSPNLTFLNKMPGKWRGKRGFLFYRDIASIWQKYNIAYLLKFRMTKAIRHALTHFRLKAFIEIDGKLLEKSLRHVEKTRVPAIVANSAPLMYQNFTDYLKKKGEGFDMPETFRIQTGGGGWNGTKGRVKLGYSIDKGDFLEKLSEFFNVPIGNFADLYGATETPVACGGHWSKRHDDILLHLNKDQGRIILRDVETMEPIRKTKQPGILEIITPRGVETYAGVSILLDDIAEIVDFNRCNECGREGIVFRIVGRLTPEVGKGCTSFFNLFPFKQ